MNVARTRLACASAFLSVFSALALCSCHQTHSVEKPPTPVKVIRVEERTEATGARYSANIEPATRVDVAFKVGGYVTAIHQVSGRNVQEGDYVQAGTVLASVRQSDYTIKVNQAKSQVLKAQAGQEASKFQLGQ